jgi:exonuclease III
VGGGGGVGTAIHKNYYTGPLLAMNNEAKYCFTSTLDTMPDDNDIISPYTQYNVNSPFFDTQSLIAKHSLHKQPLFFSLNTQNLQSKHTNITLLLSELANKQVNVDIIALQETWRIPYTEIVEIPGYTFTHKHRTANRGGGVGFYIRNTITYRVIPELSPFADNIFECITIEAKIHKKTYPLSSVYRSPNLPDNTSINAQIASFNTSLEALLSNLNTRKLNTYIFLNSNLNLLHLNTDNNVSSYHDTILNNGYLQTITRATRIHNNHFSLIDHILTNSPSTETQAGILISDISVTFSHSHCQTIKSNTSHQPHTQPRTSAQPI